MDILKKACVFIGMAVGAGFASGREVTDFFLAYGSGWKAGLIFGGILFFAVCSATSSIVRKNGITDYSGYLDTVLGGKMAAFTQWVSGLFFFIMFYAMVSASGTAAEQFFRVPYGIGVIIFIALCATILFKGIRAIESISVMLVPLLMAGMMAIAGSAGGKTVSSIPAASGSVYVSAVIYVSYNVIAAPSIMISSKNSRNLMEDILTGILCGAALTVMGIAAGGAILSEPEAMNMDFPLAQTAAGSGAVFKYCYMAVFLTAVFTTAVCNGMAAADFACEKIHIERKMAVFLLILTAFPMSFVSFTDFVSRIYPLFGFAGILQLSATGVYLLRKSKN